MKQETMTQQLFPISYFLLFIVGFAFSVVVPPCLVHNMLIQPHLGVSARTKKWVDVIQAPPLLTQTLQVGICIENEYEYNESSNSTRPQRADLFICRQRYSVVEIYSKLRIPLDKFESLRSIQRITKIPNGWQDRALTKDFILIEAGCDLLVPPPLPPSSLITPFDHASNQSEVSPALSPEQKPATQVGIDIFQQVTHRQVRLREKETNTKRSMVTKPDFLRRSLAFSNNRSSNATQKRPAILKSINNSRSDDADSRNENDTLVEASDLGTTIDDADSKIFRVLFPPGESHVKVFDAENHGSQSGYFGNGIVTQDLQPEHIGLPLIILDPSLDPILQLLKSI